MIDPLIDPCSRAADLGALYGHLRFGESVVVLGLNDVGKTTLFALAHQPPVLERFWPSTGNRPLMAHVDGNLLGNGGQQELYAVMALALSEAAHRQACPAIAARADAYLENARHEAAAAGIPPSLAFEHLLGDVVEEERASVAFLCDEFDMPLRRMHAETVLSLRAFRNRVGPAVCYALALEQPLDTVRAEAEEDAEETAEFKELFVGRTLVLRPLPAEAAMAFAQRYFAARAYACPAWLPPLLVSLAGGHAGLLWAACAAAERTRPASTAQAELELQSSPEVRDECQNVWLRLPARVREAIQAARRERPGRETVSPLRVASEVGLLLPAERIHLALPLLEHHLDRLDGPSSGLRFDARTGEVTIDGQPPSTALGPTEYRLLAALYERDGALMTKDDVARVVWPDEARLGTVDDARIDKLVDRLRSKIEPDARAPRFLLTVRGIGYRLLREP